MPILKEFKEENAVRVEYAHCKFAYCREYGDSRHVFYGGDGNPYAVEFLDVDEGIDVSDLPFDERALGRLLEEYGYKVLALR